MTRAPMMPNATIDDRATRECATSPITAIRRCIKSPNCCRKVMTSNSACVGCPCIPSPAFITDASEYLATKCGAPESGWRITSASAPTAHKVLVVFSKDSPLFTLEEDVEMLMTSAPNHFPACSNDTRVRVLSSKNSVYTDFPYKTDDFEFPERTRARCPVAESTNPKMSN